MIKAILCDFDGTLVTHDLLDVVCGIVGKRDESRLLNEQFQSGKITGLSPLITRINFLRGVSETAICKEIQKDPYLTAGAIELFRFARESNIISILHSGNILPILNQYKELLGIDHVIGTHPHMTDGIIDGISESDIPGKGFKLEGVRAILGSLGIDPKDTVALGDSIADLPMFAYAGTSIAIHPKKGIEKQTDYVVQDLHEVISIIKKLDPRLSRG
jgi:HAD superfamily phosphoserine phosphatase-like hydrolase